MKNPTVKILLETRVDLKKSPGSHPVVIQFYFQRKRTSISTGIAVTPDEFDKMLRPSPRDPKIRAYKAKLEKQFQLAEHFVKKLGPTFKHDKIKKLMEANMDKEKKTNLSAVFDIYIANLMLNDQVRTADSYRNALNSLLKYEPTLHLENISPDILDDYENWMVEENGKSRTTVGIYLRSLKAVYNFAVEEDLVDRKNYPFGRRKYVVPIGRNVKKAMTMEQTRNLLGTKTIPMTFLDKCKDFFFFSYFVNGINPRDILELKNKNLTGDQIQFVRAKTLRTKREYSPIKALVREEVKAIIEKWGNPDKSPEAYLFPILIPGMTPLQIARKVQDFVKEINNGLEKMGEDIGLSFPLTTYVARHSFATALSNKNIPIATISAALGHSSIETTKKYLDSLGAKNLGDISDSLL